MSIFAIYFDKRTDKSKYLSIILPYMIKNGESNNGIICVRMKWGI